MLIVGDIESTGQGLLIVGDIESTCEDRSEVEYKGPSGTFSD